MKLTLQIKLLPTCKQVEMLKDTFSVFNKACNAISQIAWERRVFKQFGLHKEVYYPIKETYRLSSQLVVRAISKVADAYKLDRKKQRCFSIVNIVAILQMRTLTLLEILLHGGM